MERSTYYDAYAGCYKILPEKSTNIVQKFGKMEDDIQRLYDIFNSNNSDEGRDEAARIVLSYYENA
jgi:hypothetical protein